MNILRARARDLPHYRFDGYWIVHDYERDRLKATFSRMAATIFDMPFHDSRFVRGEVPAEELLLLFQTIYRWLTPDAEVAIETAEVVSTGNTVLRIYVKWPMFVTAAGTPFQGEQLFVAKEFSLPDLLRAAR